MVIETLSVGWPLTTKEKRMSKRLFACAMALLLVSVFAGIGFAGEVEILGVKFPTEKTVEGKTLKLNGVSYLKKMGFVKVYAVGLYLENPTQNPKEVIESEQVKYMLTHYLTSKATAKNLLSRKPGSKCPRSMNEAATALIDHSKNGFYLLIHKIERLADAPTHWFSL
jgi:hypothetical protein